MDWKEIGEVLKAVGAGVAIVGGVWKVGPWLRVWWDRRSLLELSGEAHTAEDAERYTKYYIPPDCQSVDPSGLEDFRRVVVTRTPLFAAMDKIVRTPGTERFLIILADSGMGKTAFLLNYYARHRRRFWKRGGIELKLVPLNQPDAGAMIAAVAEGDRKKTVLLLDALDEDLAAVADHRKRLRELIAASKAFRSVVITCRSQFFPKDEEIPTDIGVIAAYGGAGSKGYFLQKLYLSPFTDEQVAGYLRRRYWWWQRNEAWEVVSRIPDLVARPLLLTYVEDLIASKGIEFPHQMYEVVVQKWCERERGFADPAKLREFSECLAVVMFLGREGRGMERVPEAELQPLAARFGIDLEGWKLRGRSLLNRDAGGNYEFSHRSIGEYLFVKRFADGKVTAHEEPWTERMISFAREMLQGLRAGALRTTIADLGKKIGPIGHSDGLNYVLIPDHNNMAGGIWVSQTPITVAAYKRFADITGHEVPGWQLGDNHPVVRVTWYEAEAYCRWAGGRLPTAAEWENAANCGLDVDQYEAVDKVAWHRGNSGGMVQPVAQKNPNSAGLYDMMGNVWEWCSDVTPNAYDYEWREARGGSIFVEDVRRSLHSGGAHPNTIVMDFGFRCVRELAMVPRRVV